MNKKVTRECLVCGKELTITLDDDGNFEGGYFFGIINLRIGDWTISKLVDGKFKRYIPYYKILYFKLRDLKRLILKQYKEIEYWECEECYNDEED